MKKGRKAVIAIASDHAGIDMKKLVVSFLEKQGYQPDDMGPKVRKSVNYPCFGKKVAKAVAEGRAPLGILICGTGIGMSITANRFPGVRAALVHDTFTARMAKAHNNANVLVLGGRVLGPALAEDIVKTWLETKFEGGRHQDRLDMIDGDC